MKRLILNVFRAQQFGLIIIILALGFALTMCAGYNKGINKFLNPNTIMTTITYGALFAIMAVGMTKVIITGGIDLSVGATYALSGVTMAMVLKSAGPMDTIPTLMIGLAVALGIGTLCGLINGMAVVGLRVHPFIITLGTMWIFRGVAFVSSKAASIGIPDNLINITKSTFGLGKGIYPMPMIIMLVVAIIGEIYLLKTVMGRNIYAVGGNSEAARYCGLRINRSLISVYVFAGLTAGIAAFVGATYYGASCCIDANGYELFVIASAVVGGASLMGGKGSAISAMLGAMLISLINQSILTLNQPEDYRYIIIGFAIIIAVVLDRLGAELSIKRMARAASIKIDAEIENPVITN